MKVYILGSNLYMPLLPAFAHCFNTRWGENQHVIIYGYDVKPPAVPRNFTFVSLGKQEKFSWSQGAMEMLNRIQDEHFVLMLEDYFLDKAVDTVIVYALEQMMIQHPDIVKIDLTDDLQNRPHKPVFVGGEYGRGLAVRFIETDSKAHFQGSLQAAIWRRDFMARFLSASEDAWAFEKGSTQRIIKARKDEGFEGRILGLIRPPVHYVNASGNGAPGEYVKKRFPENLWTELKLKGLVREPQVVGGSLEKVK